MLKWETVADSDSVPEVVRIVRAIADAVVLGTLGSESATSRSPIRPSPSLASGDAGAALFLAYAAKHFASREYEASALALLSRANDSIAETFTTSGLFTGFTGVAWVANHLQDVGLVGWSDKSDPLVSVDEVLFEGVQSGAIDSQHDVISGLAGVGLYALDRLPRVVAQHTVVAVIERLASLAVHKNGCATWYQGRVAPSESRIQREFPGQYVDLGVAHGVPGIVVLLARSIAGVGSDPSHRILLDGAVAAVLESECTGEPSWRFPSAVGDGAGPRPSRLSWCYGDLGVAASLTLAGRLSRRSDWEGKGASTARFALRASGSQCADLGICHGLAGIAHIFNRLGQATGDQCLTNESSLWIRRTIEACRLRGGTEGGMIDSQSPDAQASEGGVGFLTGLSGVGLVLLGAISTVEPTWDRILCLSG